MVSVVLLLFAKLGLSLFREVECLRTVLKRIFGSRREEGGRENGGNYIIRSFRIYFPKHYY
jgi:hypothetical protein